jgi:hypothetical protein
VVLVLSGQLVVLPHRCPGPHHGGGEEEQSAADDEDQRDRDPDDREREAGRVEDRQPARRRHVDLLTDRRGVDDVLGLLHHAV